MKPMLVQACVVRSVEPSSARYLRWDGAGAPLRRWALRPPRSGGGGSMHLVSLAMPRLGRAEGAIVLIGPDKPVPQGGRLS